MPNHGISLRLAVWLAALVLIGGITMLAPNAFAQTMGEYGGVLANGMSAGAFPKVAPPANAIGNVRTYQVPNSSSEVRTYHHDSNVNSANSDSAQSTDTQDPDNSHGNWVQVP